MTDEIDELYDHLAATAELPVDRTASRWLGEAEAVAADLRDCEEPAVIGERAAIVFELLEEVDGTGHPEADDRVDAARSIAGRLAEE